MSFFSIITKKGEKMPHRYFTDDIQNGIARLSGDDAHHLSRVMRAKCGETVLLCGTNALEYTAVITAIDADSVTFKVEEGVPSLAEPKIDVTVYMGYAKQDKLEQIIQHGVELGAKSFVPFFSKYCVVKPKNEDKKNVRYNRIAYEAAKQAGRGCLPNVEMPCENFTELCKKIEQHDLILFCYEGGGETLPAILKTAQKNAEKPLSIALVTGAEGGFAHKEVELALEKGATIVGLGKRILRCETAPLAALAVIMSTLGELE